MTDKTSGSFQDGKSMPRSPRRGSGLNETLGSGRQAIIQRSSGAMHLTASGNSVSPQLAMQSNSHVQWTATEMQSAQPAPMPQLSSDGALLRGIHRPQQSSSDPSNADEGQSDPGVFPKGRDANGEESLAAGGYDYPAPFTRYNVLRPCYEVYPYCCVGKLFYKQRGIRYVGTAFSIGNNAIFTAGHCIHTGDGDPEGWSSEMVFTPAYFNGQTPFGQWEVSYSQARPEWVQTGNLSEDLGGAVLRKQGGVRISDRVGALGFAWQAPREQHWHAIGYPSQSPFGGDSMVTTQSTYGYDGQVGPIPSVAIGCDMTPGCSGGPWILGFGTTNQANGLNSYRQADRPDEICSPYFDTRAKQLKDDLVGAEP